MDWKSLNLPEGSRLNRVHHFTFMCEGHTFQFEIDEFADGKFVGHGEHSTDKNYVLASVTSNSLGDCLDLLVKSVDSRKV